MKKIVIIFSFIFMMIFLVGCDDQKYITDNVIEWVSPDGVHYWVHNGKTTGISITPRYDNNGNLVIDKVEQ